MDGDAIWGKQDALGSDDASQQQRREQQRERDSGLRAAYVIVQHGGFCNKVPVRQEKALSRVPSGNKCLAVAPGARRASLLRVAQEHDQLRTNHNLNP